MINLTIKRLIGRYIEDKEYVINLVKERELHKNNKLSYSPFNAPVSIQNICIMAYVSYTNGTTEEYLNNIEDVSVKQANKLVELLELDATKPPIEQIDQWIKQHEKEL